MGAREAVGKIYSDLKSKQQDQINPFEFTKAIGKEFMPQMVEKVPGVPPNIELTVFC